jgi:predicted nucleotidyltransferase
MTIEEVKNNGWLIFEAIVGSRAYGLHNEKSDTDIKGVFVLPKDLYYSLDFLSQVNNESNDIVYYELKRFIELLLNNNPNMLELLALPKDCIIYQHPLFIDIKLEYFLSKQCEKSFANYAFTQIKKASGLEKKIMNPMHKEKKLVVDFCYVAINKITIPLVEYLKNKNIKQSECGLTKMNHVKDGYFLFHSNCKKYFGIVSSNHANEVQLSNIEKEDEVKAILFFNRDAYSVYCKQYKEYWEWVDKRNDDRFKGTMQHGKKYYAKNMMHTFRLLNMAKEIAEENKVNVLRKDREFLLDIKVGKFEYDDLVEKATAIKDSLEELFNKSNLQKEPSKEKINELLVKIRMKYYKNT